MRVTILCDASHCPEYKVAGYAFWIICNRGKFGGGAAIVRTHIPNNNVAEMMAVASTIWMGVERGIIQKEDNLLVRTDSYRAIDVFRRKHSATKDEQEVLDYYLKIKEESQLQIEFRHVKAHNGLADASSISNHVCDKYAKEHMRRARAMKMKEKKCTQ